MRTVHISRARLGAPWIVTIHALLFAVPAFAQLQGGSTYPINGTENPPTSFASIASAVSYMGSSGGVTGTGQVILELGPGYSGESGPVTIPAITGTSGTLGVTFRPTAGYSALTSIAGISGSVWAIRITGSYITLDGQAGGGGGGRDWTIRCTGPTTSGYGESAVRLDNTGVNMTDVTVKYCVLEAEKPNTTSAILAVTGASSTYTMQNVTFAGNLIRSTGSGTTNCRGYGITIATASNVANTGLVIRDNVINQFYARGINLTGGFPGMLVHRNEIAHTVDVTQASTTEFTAIYFSTVSSQGAQIYKNFIHDIRLTNGSTAVNGIYFFNGNTSGNAVRAYNNRIALGPGIQPTIEVWGIRDFSVSNALFAIDYNSVYIGGSPASGTANSGAFRKQVSSAMSLRDNIFYNARSNTGTASGTHWGISINSTTSIVAINNNDYYTSGNGGVLGTTTGATGGNQTTIGAWKAAVPADTNSFSQDPNYVNPTGAPPNLKIDTALATQVESGGTAVVGIDDDFEADIRQGSLGYAGTGTAPDVGADEFEGIPALQNDVRAVAFVDPTNGGAKITGTPFNPQASFENVGLANQSNVIVRFRIVGPSPSPTEIYNGLDTLATLNAGAGPQTATFPSVTILSDGSYTMYAKSELVGDQNTANDEIVGSFETLGPLAGTYDIGAAEPAPFNTLTGAVARLNGVGISGDVVFNLVDATYTSPAETFPITIGNYPGASPSYTVTIKPDAPGTTITGSAGAILVLDNADYVVIDGSSTTFRASRDLSISNTSTLSASAVVWLKSQGVGAGATSNTITNCLLSAGVDQSTGTTETFGIYVGGAAVSTGTGGNDNDFNSFVGNEVLKAGLGIYILGVTGNPNDGNVVSENVVGPDAFGSNQIGRGGIIIRHQHQASVTDNEVRCVGGTYALTTSGRDRVGIGLGADSWTPASSVVTSSEVLRNRVHDILDERTYSAVGIVVAGSGSPSGNVVANNMIYEVRANGTVGDQGIGIGISDGNGDVVVYNSIRIDGDIDPSPASSASQSLCGIRISSTTPANLTLKDNISHVDVNSNTSTLKHYAIVAPSAAYAWGTGGSDSNDYYAAPSNPQVVLGGIGTTVPYTAVTTLAAWQGQFTPNQDGSSLAVEPPFVSATDLHLQTGVPTALEGNGAPIAQVTDDFDAELRNIATPDIGCDEGDFTQLVDNDVAAVAFIDPLQGGTKIGGTPFAPQASFENLGGLDQTDVPVRFRIEGPAPATTEVYNDLDTLAVLNAFAGPSTATFPQATINAGGVYTMYATSELVGDENTANDEIVGTFAVLTPLVGTYDVGAGEPVPFNTLTGAVGALNTVGIAGDVVFNLVDASYTTPDETFPLTIGVYPGMNPLYTVTFKPDATGTVISGSSVSAIVVLDGADHVVIDGSSGQRGRDLTIRNSSTSSATAGIWLRSTGAGAGATNNVIRNCVIECGVDQSASTSETFGIIATGATISTSTGGNDNDLNTFASNAIRKVRWGIYLLGVSGNPNDGNTVGDNLIGPDAFGSDQIGKGGIVLRHQNEGTVAGNEVGYVGIVQGQSAGGSDRVGIGLGADTWSPTATPTTLCVVERNLIHHVVDEKTFSAVGIVVAGSGSPSGNVVANNMIHEIRANGTAGDQALGIGIGSGDGDTVVFNSISMSGDLDPAGSTTATQSACGIRISSTTPVNLTLRNNIMSVDVTSNTATLMHHAIVAPSAAYVWGTGGSDNNDYYVPAGNPQMALGGLGTTVPYTAVATLAAWQATFTPNQDAASIDGDPRFVGGGNLHIQTGEPISPVANAGTPIPGVSDDFDGETRSATTPDIGADEFAVLGLYVEDVTRSEGSGGTTDFAFIVRLRAFYRTGVVRVDYATEDSTATAPDDYLEALGQLVFAPGDTADTVHVTVIGDVDPESDEVFKLVLSNPVNCVIGDGLAIGTILDDDTSIAVPEIPAMTFLGQSFPNPFAERLRVTFGLHEAGSVRLQIFDVQGRLVRELVHAVLPAGYQRADWDGLDGAGHQVGAGLYFLRLETPKETFRQRVLVTR